MSDFDEFKSYYALADQLMRSMTPEQLADCLRILALHVGDYRLRFGEIPGQDLLALIGTTEISDDQARLLRAGIRWSPDGKRLKRRRLPKGAAMCAADDRVRTAGLDRS